MARFGALSLRNRTTRILLLSCSLSLMWMARVTPVIAQVISDDTVEITPDDEVEITPEDSGDESVGDVDPEAISEDANPLNPAGDSLDKLIQVRFNEDVWTAMLGDLPCLDVTEPCVR